MNDVVEALVSTVDAVCARYADPEQTWNPRLWDELEKVGVTLLPVPEERGGAGADLATAAEVLRALGRHAAAVPLAETALLAGWLLADVGADVPSGPLTAALAGPDVALRQDGDGWRLSGTLPRVPWARHAEGIAVLVGGQVAYVPRGGFEIDDGANLAGEPRDTVHLRDAAPAHVLASAATAQAFRERGALGRTALMAGAMETATGLALRYAGERVQFGRPLAKFQAVQQHLAEMAGETLMARVAAQAAAAEGTGLAVAAAKAAVSEAAGTVCRLAHQVHGAIGFTDEHGLRHATTRLWAWRDECGNEAEWGEAVGGRALDAGAGGLWPLITDGGA
ncbi:acyl-CoA dehydrogenase family protein [Actinomadura opuntiae]|uniref:acyl-CoA dehydrogenase family protein n=1 Tax=Actinomadura sp. OS1-43 TaxID=604315 RepID=UPI00255A8116|nr:acyl-CoA dehydrogenase family protein [Actinomadura sp. OS1-43]MDL4819775.1 acyl-CoA dehydrogenase family protein [Actinomadura sp. OS1-43]